jgi:hypothetical protein
MALTKREDRAELEEFFSQLNILDVLNKAYSFKDK